MPTRRTGINPLAYLGVEAPQPPNIVFERRAPTTNDYQGFNTGDIWVNNSAQPPNTPTMNDVYMLVSKNKRVNPATWIPFGAGTLRTLTGDAGGAVSPNAAGNINTLGTAGQIVTTGNPATNTITWSLAGAVATTYTTDAGVATPAANNLNILGSNAITTSGAGSTVTINSIRYDFLAFLNAIDANVTGAGAEYFIGTNVALTEVFDPNNVFNTNGTYTAPVTGVYQFNASIGLSGLAVGMDDGRMWFQVDATRYRFDNANFLVQATDSLDRYIGSGSILVNLTAAQTVRFGVWVSGGAGNTVAIMEPSGVDGARRTFFSGFLVR